VFVPASNKESITENGNAVSSSKDLQVTGIENGYVILKVNSGKYHFEVSK
jgi:alpha-L-rhamnosidase